MCRAEGDLHVRAMMDVATGIEDWVVVTGGADEEITIAEDLRDLALRLAEWRYGASEREALASVHWIVTPLWQLIRAQDRWEER